LCFDKSKNNEIKIGTLWIANFKAIFFCIFPQSTMQSMATSKRITRGIGRFCEITFYSNFELFTYMVHVTSAETIKHFFPARFRAEKTDKMPVIFWRIFRTKKTDFTQL
jgi:hypothetical protein